MCDLLSGWINIKTDEIEIADLRSHSVTQNHFGWSKSDLAIRREWEWMEDDEKSLGVRVLPEDRRNENWWRAIILAKWPTRQDAIQDCIQICVKAGADTLDLTGCTGLKALPDGLKVNWLDLTGCTGLKALPDDLEVNILDLAGCTGLTALPEGLKVNYLDLTRCTGLKALPEGLEVNTLYLNGCTGLKALPEGLTDRCEVVGWAEVSKVCFPG